MIAAGEGFSLIPCLALEHRAELQTLVTVRPIQGKEAKRTISLMWRPSDPRAESFKELAAFLRSQTPEGCTKLSDPS